MTIPTCAKDLPPRMNLLTMFIIATCWALGWGIRGLIERMELACQMQLFGQFMNDKQTASLQTSLCHDLQSLSFGVRDLRVLRIWQKDLKFRRTRCGLG